MTDRKQPMASREPRAEPTQDSAGVGERPRAPSDEPGSRPGAEPEVLGTGGPADDPDLALPLGPDGEQRLPPI